jgi:hypothetical protein
MPNPKHDKAIARCGGAQWQQPKRNGGHLMNADAIKDSMSVVPWARVLKAVCIHPRRGRELLSECRGSHSEEPEGEPLTSRVVCSGVGVRSRCRNGIAKTGDGRAPDQVAPITGDYTNDN